MGWQVNYVVSFGGKYAWFHHRGTNWWAALLSQKQQNQSGFINRLDCLALWYTSSLCIFLQITWDLHLSSFLSLHWAYAIKKWLPMDSQCWTIHFKNTAVCKESDINVRVWVCWELGQRNKRSFYWRPRPMLWPMWIINAVIVFSTNGKFPHSLHNRVLTTHLLASISLSYQSATFPKKPAS